MIRNRVMSGGHFDYQQYVLGSIADEIEQLIRNNDDESLDEWGCKNGRGYSPETIAEFQKGVELLRKAHVYAQRIDWLVSDDDSEETFQKRLQEDLEKLDEDFSR